MSRRPRWTSSLGGRLALLTAVAVSVAVAGVSVAAWAATDRTLRAQVDSALLGIDRPAATSVEGAPTPPREPEVLCAAAGQTRELSTWLGSVQVVRADGSTCTAVGGLEVAPREEDLALAAAAGPGVLRDDRALDGTHVRVRTVHVEEGYALLVVRDLTEVDATLRQLGVVLVVVTLLGAVTSVLAGYLVARSGLRPVDRLTGAVEEIARTQDLSVPLPVSGDDEVARLSAAFNRMTEALRVSRARQQQLIVDAGHELRTPLTSLRTNLELLALSERSGRELPPDDRADLLLSVSAQLVELSALVDELVELADDAPEPEPVRFDLMDVVDRAVERASRRGTQHVAVRSEPWPVHGDPEAVERAVVNLLDNALKFSPATSTVDVTLAGGTLEVADRGPGVDATTATHAFDRFWRSPQARGLAGSGLGLAIVRDVAQRHGGHADLRPRDGGGAVARLTLPPAGDGAPSRARVVPDEGGWVVTDDGLDIERFDGGLRTSVPPDGFQEVRSWTLHATSELSPFRNQLAEVLLAAGITIGEDRDSAASKIVLIASELAANALTHGRPPTEVWLRRSGPTWLLEVADHDNSTTPIYAGVREPGAGGLGLHLARHLSLDVGWFTTADTKNIWVTFA